MFYTDAYLADTRHLSTIEHGAYLLMLFHAWREPDCSLPNDDNYLARITGMDLRTFRKHRANLLHFWHLDTQQRWVQLRLKDERIIAERKRSKNVEAGKASALKRKARGYYNSQHMLTSGVSYEATNAATSVQPERNERPNQTATKSQPPEPYSTEESASASPQPLPVESKSQEPRQFSSTDRRANGGGTAAMTSEEWNAPDITQIADRLVRLCRPRHWHTSPHSRAMSETITLLLGESDPQGTADEIARVQAMYLAEPASITKNMEKQEFAYFVKDRMFEHPPKKQATKAKSGFERDMELAARLEAEENAAATRGKPK